jgi:hypothetical protein
LSLGLAVAVGPVTPIAPVPADALAVCRSPPPGGSRPGPMQLAALRPNRAAHAQRAMPIILLDP